MSKEIDQAVYEVAQRDLAKRVRGKVREKYGTPTPETEQAGPGDLPEVVGPQGPPTVIPRRLVKRIDRLAMIGGDTYSFRLTLEVNGYELPVDFAISGHALAVVKHEAAQRVILDALVQQAVRAITDAIRHGINKDILELVQQHEWSSVDKLGIFPFGGSGE